MSNSSHAHKGRSILTQNSNEEFEFSVEGEAKALLVEIAGDGEDSMLSEAETADLLHAKDIYHYQGDAVRKVRKFLAA